MSMPPPPTSLRLIAAPSRRTSCSIPMARWANDGCPFVQKHYNSKNMQQTQAAATKDGVVWLSVISSKPGSQRHVDAAAANKLATDRGAKPTHVLLDPDGSMGQ